MPEILIQIRKDKCAARRFFRKLLKGQERTPIELATDKLRSYGAAKREMMPPVVHCQDNYANNRAEVSHEHTLERERQMRGFKSDVQAQRFLGVYGQMRNLFRVGAPYITGGKLSSLVRPRVRDVAIVNLRPVRQDHDLVNRLNSPRPRQVDKTHAAISITTAQKTEMHVTLVTDR